MGPARGWLRGQLSAVSRRARVRTRAWLIAHPRTRRFLASTGSLDVDEYTLARGVAVGLFIGLTPTVGAQTLLMLIASMALRANFPAMYVASLINNPLTFAPIYLGYIWLGEYLMRFMPIRFPSLSGVEEEIAEGTAALVIGSLTVAIPAGLIGYVLFLYVWRRFDLHLPRRLSEETLAAAGEPSKRGPGDTA
jgi:uncharacterized protein (DUF2062 family)